MTLSDQFANDHEHIDGVVDVKVVGRGSDGNAVVKDAAKGLKRSVAVGPGGAVQNETRSTRWHLWASTLAGYEPEPGDTITYGGDSWTIESTALVTLDTRWQCECRKVRT